MANPQFKRGATLGLAIAASATIIAGVVPSASAETRIETVIGAISGVDPIRTSYIRKTPTDERVCQTQDVPVYADGGGNNDSDLGAMVIGGVIGSAIGNKTSDNDGAGAAGAVVGALLGREHAKKNSGGQKIIGYRQQEVCNIRTVMMEQTVEEITGYRLRVEVDGKIISLESQNPRAVGERIEINRRTIYSLR